MLAELKVRSHRDLLAFDRLVLSTTALNWSKIRLSKKTVKSVNFRKNVEWFKYAYIRTYILYIQSELF